MAEEQKNALTHVAIIMDGNGRWAQERGLPRTAGHVKGAGAVRTIVTAARELGISVLSLYAFSSENWKRPENEVSALMGLLKRFANNEAEQLEKANIKVRFIGNRDMVPKKIRHPMQLLEERTASCDGMVLQIAVSYGGREELVRAINKLRLLGRHVTEDDITEALDTAGIPDPDLVVRTSGEMRISGFMPWQCTYSEFTFTKTLWPDFTAEEFEEILAEYAGRDRRFGKVTVAAE